jgi:hypothetical protein
VKNPFLSAVSRLVKRLKGLEPIDSPGWTDAFEQTLSSLSIKKLEHLEYLLEQLSIHKPT